MDYFSFAGLASYSGASMLVMSLAHLGVAELNPNSEASSHSNLSFYFTYMFARYVSLGNWTMSLSHIKIYLFLNFILNK